MIYHYVMWKLSAEIKSCHYQGEYPNLLCQHFHFVCACGCRRVGYFRAVPVFFVSVWSFASEVISKLDVL